MKKYSSSYVPSMLISQSHKTKPARNDMVVNFSEKMKRLRGKAMLLSGHTIEPEELLYGRMPIRYLNNDPLAFAFFYIPSRAFPEA